MDKKALEKREVPEYREGTPMFCGRCGAKITDGNSYCVYCGATLTVDRGETSGDKPSNVNKTVESKSTRTRKKKHRSLIIILILIVILVVLLFLSIAVIHSGKNSDSTVTQVASEDGTEDTFGEVIQSAAEPTEENALVAESSAFVDPYADLPLEVADALREASDDIDQELFSDAYKILKYIENGDDYSEVTDMRNRCQYEWACYSMSQEDYESAHNRFVKLGDYEDAADKAEECTYLVGKAYLATGDNYNAYVTLSEIPEYSDVSELLSQLEAELYDEAVALYEELVEKEEENGEDWHNVDAESLFSYDLEDKQNDDTENTFDTAKKIFAVIDGYKKSSMYNLLIKADLEKLSAQEYADFLALMPSENSCGIATSSAFTSKMFLEGIWKDYSGSYYISFNSYLYSSDVTLVENIKVSSNLPQYSIDGYTHFLGNVYCITTDDMEVYIQFIVKAVDRNTINVYCENDGNTYTFYRQ